MALFMFEVGATVFLTRHPAIAWVVIKRMSATDDNTYVLRQADNPTDTRGSLVWEDAIAKGKVTFYKAIPKGQNIKASDTFVDAYITCALWSTNDESTPEGGEPFDSNYSVDDMTDECKAAMRADCDAFVKANAADVARMANDSQAGHDFWLTRNGHGAGFWDRDLGDLGDRLTAAAKEFGETGLYLGDDKRIHHGF